FFMRSSMAQFDPVDFTCTTARTALLPITVDLAGYRIRPLWLSGRPWSEQLRALLIKTAASCDFETSARMPIKRACRSISLSPNALYIMSGTEGMSRLSIRAASSPFMTGMRSEEHTSELQSRGHLVCRLLLEKSHYHRALHSFPTRRSSDLLRALLIKTAASCDFETSARMPIKRACRSISLSPNALYIMSGTEGMSRLSIRAASSPFMTGMERSSTINSGRSCWAFSIASFPFSASPHTARSASRWKRSQSTLRIHGLSSTIRTDLQEWELGDLMSCLLWLPDRFDLNFNFGPLFQSRFLALLTHQSVLNANFPIQ